jgi:hypothetical protein
VSDLEELEKQAMQTQKARLQSERKVSQLAAGVSPEYRELKEKLTCNLNELSNLNSDNSAIFTTMATMVELASNPVLTREASKQIMESLNSFVQLNGSNLQTVLQDIQNVINKFVSEYTVEIEKQKQARLKEAETLELLNRYLQIYI